VKIESLEGDDTRNQLADRTWAERKMAPSFLAVNGNKRSITLDLRKPEAVAIVKKLAAAADVVWENFRGGVMERLGLGYEALSAVNPRLIYCSVSGFGQNGPERTTAAFDGKLQAMSGIMSITGEPAHGPTRAGFAICDTIGGMTAALAVSSALYQRTHTGRGQLVDVAMLDAALAFIPGTVSEYTVAGIEARQLGNGSVSRKPTASRFRARGGYLVLAVLTEKTIPRAGRHASRPLTCRAGPSGRSTRSSSIRSSSTATCCRRSTRATDRCGWSAPDSGSSTVVPGSIESRRPSASTPTRS
jgi:crotonobetainyl-CoA:carnitine CoA-transferase CaiB-like acyl-CoA transferase